MALQNFNDESKQQFLAPKHRKPIKNTVVSDDSEITTINIGDLRNRQLSFNKVEVEQPDQSGSQQSGVSGLSQAIKGFIMSGGSKQFKDKNGNLVIQPLPFNKTIMVCI